MFRSQIPRENLYFGQDAPNYALLKLKEEELKGQQESVKKIIESEIKWSEVAKVNKTVKTLKVEYLIDFETEGDKLTKYLIGRQQMINEDDEEGEDEKETEVEKMSISKLEDLQENFQTKKEKDHTDEMLKKYISETDLTEEERGELTEETKTMLKKEDEELEKFAEEF